MKIEDVIEYFGSGYNMQKLHGLSHSNFAHWRKLGYVPITTQIKIERLTKGALKASLNHCPRE